MCTKLDIYDFIKEKSVSEKRNPYIKMEKYRNIVVCSL